MEDHIRTIRPVAWVFLVIGILELTPQILRMVFHWQCVPVGDLQVLALLASVALFAGRLRVTRLVAGLSTFLAGWIVASMVASLFGRPIGLSWITLRLRPVTTLSLVALQAFDAAVLIWAHWQLRSAAVRKAQRTAGMSMRLVRWAILVGCAFPLGITLGFALFPPWASEATIALAKAKLLYGNYYEFYNNRGADALRQSMLESNGVRRLQE